MTFAEACTVLRQQGVWTSRNHEVGTRARLGIPTGAGQGGSGGGQDRCWEPIFEADFMPCSYGFRPKAVGPRAAMERFAVHGFIEGHTFVVEFDHRQISLGVRSTTTGLLTEVESSGLGPAKMLKLLRWWLQAGGAGRWGGERGRSRGTPQGGVVFPVAGQRLPARARHRTLRPRGG